MALQFSDNFQVNSPKDLNNKTGRFTQGAWRPFNDIAEAQTTVVLGARYIGLTQLILKDGVPTEYWYRDGTSDGQLIVKSPVDLSNYVTLNTDQEITGKKTFDNNVSLVDNSSGVPEVLNNAQLSLQKFYSNDPIRFYNQYDATVGRPQIFATGLLDGDYDGAAGDVTAGWLKWNTSGTKGNINGLMLQLAPGYTGTGTTRVIDAQNYIGGASTFNAYDMSANVGVAAESQGLSTGDNVGVYGIAGFAEGRNIAGFFRATQDASDYQSDNKVGVFGIAGRLELDTGYSIGGVFSLQQWQDVRNILNTNAALIANNGDMPHPIFLGKVSGEDVFEIKRYGDVSIKSIGTTDIPLSIETNASITNDIVQIYKGTDKMATVSRFGDVAMRGRVLFYDNPEATVTVQALYVDSSSGRTVIRAGTRANKVGIYNSTASSFVDFDGATASMKLGGTVQSLTAPNDGARIGGALILGDDPDNGAKLQVSGKATVSDAPTVPTGIVRLTDLGNFVNTTGNQTGILGDKIWSGFQEFRAGLSFGSFTSSSTLFSAAGVGVGINVNDGTNSPTLYFPTTKGNGTIALTTDLANYVNTTSNQTAIAGDKTFIGAITAGIISAGGKMFFRSDNTLRWDSATTGNAKYLAGSNTTFTENIVLNLPDKPGILMVLTPVSVADPIPSSSSSSGKPGVVMISGGYRYECIDTDTWVRSAVSTF